MGQSRRCVVLLWLVVGCIEPQLVPCGDQLCPTGSSCVAGDRCASDEQIAACTGVAEGEACTVRGSAGRCEQGICIATGCGNSVLDPDEACDDGNQASGDGCRADCRKIEMCGDAVVDDGEGCDDGNSNPADGCDACVPTTWRATAVIRGQASAASVGLTPASVVLDRSGALFILDRNRVRRLSADGIITNVAGGATAGFAGDGGLATSALLDTPGDIAIDGLGNIYIADTFNERVRRIDPSGIITTFAGTGTYGYGGDGGPATGAQLYRPSGIAVDGLGNVFIADTANQRIRRVDPSGTITTIAGTGVYASTGDGGPATAAALSPTGLAVDGLGNLYLGDLSSIRRIDPAGIITTVAGYGGPGFSGDGGPAVAATLSAIPRPAVDRLGTLYIADRGNDRIRRVDTAGIITTVAGTGTMGFFGDGGPATSAWLFGPSSVAVADDGTLYIADLQNHRIRRVDPAGTITTHAGNGHGEISGEGAAATAAQLGYPFGVEVDGLGNLYIADAGNHQIRRVDPTGVITTIAGTGVGGPPTDGGPATASMLSAPTAVTTDPAGNIYLLDGHDAVRRIDPNGILTRVAGAGTTGYGGDGGPALAAQLHDPEGIAVDSQGNLYIADSANHRIRRVDGAGIITTVAGTGTAGYGGDGGAATSAQLQFPCGIAFDAQDNLYIADRNNARVRRVAANGIITTVAGDGIEDFGGDGGPATSAHLWSPWDVAIDPTGNLYISDNSNALVRKVDVNGVITTVAGVYGLTSNGEGGLAIEEPLTLAFCISTDKAGNLLIADADKHRVRRVSTSGILTTAAGIVDPERTGPLAQARLATPRALAIATPFTLFAGGTSGTIEAIRTGSQWLEVVTGRYPQLVETGTLARFRSASFGTIGGVAYDEASGLIYFTESSTNRLHVVTIVASADVHSWTIAPLANAAGTAGHVDGSLATARFRNPAGLYFDAAARQLYVADTGNHVIRAIDLSAGAAAATVRTVAGIPATRGFFGDGAAATAALLFEPQAVTRCANGDLFIADTGSHRVRRVAASDGTISTVLGDGVAASSGVGRPASTFPVDAPLGLACDALGNLFVTSTTAVRLLPADASGIVDGSGEAQLIFGNPPRDTFPASVTSCLTGLAVVDAMTVQVVDSCTGILVELHREPK